MIQANELLTLIIGVGVTVFILVNRIELRRLPFSGFLLTSYSFLFSGWVFTVIEEVAFRPTFNSLEHFSFMMSSILAAIWCWKVFITEKGAGL